MVHLVGKPVEPHLPSLMPGCLSRPTAQKRQNMCVIFSPFIQSRKAENTLLWFLPPDPETKTTYSATQEYVKPFHDLSPHVGH